MNSVLSYAVLQPEILVPYLQHTMSVFFDSPIRFVVLCPLVNDSSRRVTDLIKAKTLLVKVMQNCC